MMEIAFRGYCWVLVISKEIAKEVVNEALEK